MVLYLPSPQLTPGRHSPLWSCLCRALLHSLCESSLIMTTCTLLNVRTCVHTHTHTSSPSPQTLPLPPPPPPGHLGERVLLPVWLPLPCVCDPHHRLLGSGHCHDLLSALWGGGCWWCCTMHCRRWHADVWYTHAHTHKHTHTHTHTHTYTHTYTYTHTHTHTHTHCTQ